MNSDTYDKVKKHVKDAMDKLIEKRTVTEPFNETDIAQNNPFGYRLVPIEVWKGSKFERSFVTTLGQGIFEQLGRIIAEGSGAVAYNQHDTDITLNTFKTQTIDTTIRNQRTVKSKRGTPSTLPNISHELKHLSTLDNEQFEKITIKSDLYIQRKNGTEEFYSFKTVKPNLDQTAEAKKNLLQLRCFNPNYQAYFALPFNPAGEGNPYTMAHTMPTKLFDMSDTNYVLMGGDLWNKIGNDPTTYTALLDIFDEVGKIVIPTISTKYFGN